MKRYDLNLLAALDALLREPSVSAAARRLGIGQPAMSAALARLRVMFGDPLLVRTPRGMEPTPRARELAVPLRKTLGELRALVYPPVTFDPPTARRSFRISGGDYAGMTILPSLVAGLRHDAPGIDIRYRYVEKDALAGLLDCDELDLAIAVAHDLPTRFKLEPLIEETFICGVRAGHPLLDAPVTPERFAEAEHLLVTERADERGCMDAVLEQQGMARRIVVTVPSAALVAGVLAHTDLVATIPRRAGEHMAESANITLFAPPVDAGRWTMSLICLERNMQDPALRWMRERIQQSVGGKGLPAGHAAAVGEGNP